MNPRLNYSQGMNFVAGFLYLTILPEDFIYSKDKFTQEVINQASNQAEALAYMVLSRVISRFQMENLFNDEIPMLKLMFY